MGHSREDEGSPIVMEAFWDQVVPGTRQRHGNRHRSCLTGTEFVSLAIPHLKEVPWPDLTFTPCPTHPLVSVSIHLITEQSVLQKSEESIILCAG